MVNFSGRYSAMLPTLRIFEYNYSIHQRIPQSKYKYLTLRKYLVFVQKYFWPTHQLNYNKSSRRLGLVQGLYNLVSHSGSLRQILTELIIRTVSLGSLPKRIQASRWLVSLHQPEYMTHILSGDGGDIPLEGPWDFAKSPRQRERFISVPFWDVHGLDYLQGSIPDFPQAYEFSMHRVS